MRHDVVVYSADPVPRHKAEEINKFIAILALQVSNMSRIPGSSFIKNPVEPAPRRV
jgi:hypothetical protein